MLNAYSLPIGNAVKLLGSVPAGTLSWVLLRNTSGTFSGHADPNASLIATGGSWPRVYVVDSTVLTNNQTYHYQIYAYNGTAWAATDAVSVVPAWAVEDQSVDPLALIRDRLEVGLRNYVAQGFLFHEQGAIPVLTAPPLFDETPLPVVTVHLGLDASAERAIGEHIIPDEVDLVAGEWSDSEGWYSRYDITVAGYDLNPDARIALRKAVKALVIGNFPVFAAAGMLQIDFTVSDMEDMESYGAPVYMAMGKFTCLAPSVMVTTDPRLLEVDQVITSRGENIFEAYDG